MVEVIIEKIKRKMIRSIKDKEELERTLRKIDERAAMMKENYSSNKSKDLNTRKRELEKKYGMDTAEYTMPASATETANVNATNHNKA
jgi:DNA-directed RNA polymerase specialized sigma subunit